MVFGRCGIFLENEGDPARRLCRGMGREGIDDESDQVQEGRSVDALALRGDEGRGTLR